MQSVRYKPIALALLFFLNMTPGASAEQAKHKHNEKTAKGRNVWNYDGGVFFETDGSLPNGGVFSCPRPDELGRFLQRAQAHRHRSIDGFPARQRNGNEVSRFRHGFLFDPGPALSCRSPASGYAPVLDGQNDRGAAAFALLEARRGFESGKGREGSQLPRGPHPALRRFACRGFTRALRVVVSVRGPERRRIPDG